MTWMTPALTAQEGDLAQLVGLSHKHFIFRLQPGGKFESHRGVILHDDLIGRPWGTQVFSHKGNPFFMLQPSIADLIRNIKRNTQILYPKDIGFILITMGIGPGMKVLEAGTGSGGLTSAFAFAVGPQGSVVTYEQREQSHLLAKNNLHALGLDERVTFKFKSITEDGFDETGADALFLDMPNPYEMMHHVRAALKPGGFFGTILPTANQVIRLLAALRVERFAFVDVVETYLRYYKPESSRFRPTDRMVAHTGYLIFARPVTIADDLPADLPDPALAEKLLREAGLLELKEKHPAAVPDSDLEDLEIDDSPQEELLL